MTKHMIPATLTRVAAAAALIGTITLAAAAQAEDAKIPAGMFTNAQSPDQYLAKDQLIGAKVHGPDGKIIGDIEDLIINDYNLVTAVVMGTGGFMGIAEKKVGVNVQALKFGEKDGKTEISLPEATREVLAAAEPYKRAQPKKSLLERAKEKAQEMTDKSTAAAKPMLDTATEKTKDAYEKAKEAAKPMLDTATEKTKEAYEKAKDAAGTAVDSAKKAINSATTPAPEAPKP
jgi:uncharacterized protein YjbJ (UPF0337 family)